MTTSLVLLKITKSVPNMSDLIDDFIKTYNIWFDYVEDDKVSVIDRCDNMDIGIIGEFITRIHNTLNSNVVDITLDSHYDRAFIICNKDELQRSTYYDLLSSSRLQPEMVRFWLL